MIVTILAMACVTFATRYVFLAKKLPFTIGPKMQHLLSFSAPCVLTAIWVPIVFLKDNRLAINTENSYLIAATVAVVLAYKFKNLYITTLGSLAVFYALF